MYSPCCCQGLTGMYNNKVQSQSHVLVKWSILILVDTMMKYIVPYKLFKCRRDWLITYGNYKFDSTKRSVSVPNYRKLKKKAVRWAVKDRAHIIFAMMNYGSNNWFTWFNVIYQTIEYLFSQFDVLFILWAVWKLFISLPSSHMSQGNFEHVVGKSSPFLLHFAFLMLRHLNIRWKSSNVASLIETPQTASISGYPYHPGPSSFNLPVSSAHRISV